MITSVRVDALGYISPAPGGAGDSEVTRFTMLLGVQIWCDQVLQPGRFIKLQALAEKTNTSSDMPRLALEMLRHSRQQVLR